MFGDIPLCGDEPYDDELEDAGAERPEKKKKKKRKAAEVDFEAISSAGWSETASLAESELGKKLESERLTRLEEEAARKRADKMRQAEQQVWELGDGQIDDFESDLLDKLRRAKGTDGLD